MAKRKGILGKVLDQVTPDEDDGKKGPGGLLGKVIDQVTPDDKKAERAAAPTTARRTRKKQGGLIGAIKDRMDGDDESKSTDVSSAAKPTATRKKRGGVIGAIQDRFDGDDDKSASSGSGSTMGAPASGPVSSADQGTVIGSGMNRIYVSRAGDSMAAIAAFFYGDATHRQRLLDDNPELEKYMGALPGGLRIRVSEDAARGDTVKNSGY